MDSCQSMEMQMELATVPAVESSRHLGKEGYCQQYAEFSFVYVCRVVGMHNQASILQLTVDSLLIVV